jgi:hypothetical protein
VTVSASEALPPGCSEADGRLEAILAGEDGGSAAILSHIEQCARCRAAMDVAGRVDALLRTMPAVAPPPDFTDRVVARVRRERWHAEERFDRAFNLTLAAALVLLVAGAVALVNLSGLGALLVDAARVARGGLAVPGLAVPRGIAATSAALVVTAITGWWWATRRFGY